MTSANIVAERIRKSQETYRLKLDTGSELAMAISGGGAWCKKNENIAQGIERADAYLYQAKRSGRNRIVTESDNCVDEKARQKIKTGSQKNNTVVHIWRTYL
jgi:diguanylate cyclase